MPLRLRDFAPTATMPPSEPNRSSFRADPIRVITHPHCTVLELAEHEYAASRPIFADSHRLLKVVSRRA